jgi:hypothetical protein
MSIQEKLMLKGKKAFITGGARGIGKSVSIAMAQAGADIAIVDINIDEAQKTASELEAYGVKTAAVYADVTNPGDVDKMINTVLNAFGTIDIAFNNAGICINEAAQDMSYESWKKVIDVNLTGVFKTDPITSERFVQASSIQTRVAGSTNTLSPLFLAGSSIGGSSLGLQDGVWSKDWVRQTDNTLQLVWSASQGLNNVGLLVKVCGKITQIDPAGQYFYIDDGSNLRDGSKTSEDDNVGIRVVADGRSFQRGQMFAVTGISSCFKAEDGKLLRLLRVESQEDITPIPAD